MCIEKQYLVHALFKFRRIRDILVQEREQSPSYRGGVAQACHIPGTVTPSFLGNWLQSVRHGSLLPSAL
jgi:hypothetical protein